MSRHLLLTALALVAGIASAATLGAQDTKYIAFGDSVTSGVGFDDCDCVCPEEGECPCRQECGYPTRLEARLGNNGDSVVVFNAGLGGERTPDGVSRLDDVLAAEGGDVLLLMEGTNDVNREISIETTIRNLDEMAIKARRAGLDVVHATVIPRRPDAKKDRENHATRALVYRIRDLAYNQGRELADPFEVFETTPSYFDALYYQGSDPVGHPDAEGFDELADVFFDVIRGIDSVAPVAGSVTPADGAVEVPTDAEIRVRLHDFDAGIDLAETSLVVDGVVVDSDPAGDAFVASLVWEPDEPLTGTVEVRYRSTDRAVPANSIDRLAALFTIEGFTPPGGDDDDDDSGSGLDGDVDGDGRVDGADLVALAIAFGTTEGQGRYDRAADLDSDGDVDGDDLAILAANFGQSE